MEYFRRSFSLLLPILLSSDFQVVTFLAEIAMYSIDLLPAS